MNQTYSNYEIIFVDAGSTDGSVEYVKKNFPEIIVIKCGRIGIGEAINLGIKRSSGTIISFDFNTDEYVYPNWLEELVKHLKKFNYNIVTGTTRLIYGTNLIDEAGVEINYFGLCKKLGHKKDINTYKFEDKPVTQVSSPTFHRKILKKIGLVDETYFIYAEDLDFCYRAKLVGFEVYNAPLARSYHHISGTIGPNVYKREYFLRRAQMRFQTIYFSPIRMIICLLFMCCLLPSHSLIRAVISPKKFSFFGTKFRAELKAIGWNLINLRKTMLRRKQINHLKKV